jgi:hypothetical protein
MSSQLGKKILSVTLATTTTVWLSGVSMLVPFMMANAAPGNLMDGDIFHVSGDPKVYIAKMVGAKNFKRWVQTPEIFNSYLHLKWENLKTVTVDVLNAYTETALVRALGDTKVYYVTAPDRRWVASPAALTANSWDWDSVYTINSFELALYREGAPITGAIGATPTPSPTVTTLPGSVLQVGAPGTQIAATTFVSDNDAAGGAQSLADVVKIKFTAGTDGDVKVKKLVLTRGGISADADISDMYLYDGAVRVAESPSISSAKITFSNATGMFTVTKGMSKEITVKLDLASNTAGGKTMHFSVGAASDVETDGATVQGTFALMSNTHSTANVTDLGRILFQNSYPSANTTVDAQNNLDIWRFTVAASNQDIELRRFRVTIVGTVNSTDLTNFKLMDGGAQVPGSATIANLDSNKVADFDLSGTPLKIKSGITKTLTLRADVVGGTNRTFRASIQKRADVEVFDAGYKVMLRPMTAAASDTFSIMQPNANANFSGANVDFTVNAGSITATVAVDSPAGNVAVSGTNVVLSRYDFKASGEDVKVTDLAVCVDWSASNTATHGFQNGQVFINDGSGTAYAQVGTTDSNLTVDDTAAANCDDAGDFNAFSLGSQFIVKAGKTRQVEVRADMTSTGTGAAAVAAGQTIVVTLNNGNSSSAANAQGLVSLTSITVPSANLAGRSVTVASGAISVAANGGMADYSVSNPLIVGQSNARIASIVVTAGAGEAVDMTSIVLQANGTDGREWGRNMTNLKVCKVGTACAGDGNQIGATVASLSRTDETESKTFTVSPATRINAGTSVSVDVHADILTSASDTAVSIAGVRVALNGVTATGVTTGTSSSAPAAATAMQNIFIAAAGAFTIAAASDSVLPVAQIYKMSSPSGTNEVVVGKFTLNSQFENTNVERVTVNDTFSGGVGTSTRASSTLKNIRLYVGSVSGSNLLAGPTGLVATITPVVGGYADFNGGFNAVTGQGITVGTNGTYFVIPKDTTKTIVVTAEVNSFLEASSGQTHLFSLQANTQLSAPGPQRAIVSKGSVSSVSTNGPTAAANIGKSYEIRRNYPIVAPSTSGLTGLATGTTGDKTFYKFTVQAPAGDKDVRVKKMTFEVTLNDTTTSTILSLSDWRLKRNGSFVTASDYRFFNSAVATTSAFSSLGGTASIVGCAAASTCDDNEASGLRAYAAEITANTNTGNSSTTKVTLALAGEEIIDQSATNTYELVANVNNFNVGAATDSDSIGVRILGDTNSLADDRTGDVSVPARFSTAGHSAIFLVDSDVDDSNFIWSDLWDDLTAHTSVAISATVGTVTNGHDWTNSVFVPENVGATDFLPTSTYTTSRQ